MFVTITSNEANGKRVVIKRSAACVDDEELDEHGAGGAEPADMDECYDADEAIVNIDKGFVFSFCIECLFLN